MLLIYFQVEEGLPHLKIPPHFAQGEMVLPLIKGRAKTSSLLASPPKPSRLSALV